jgi:hypothetical protein
MSSYVWEVRQRGAAAHYGFACAQPLQPILVDARQGSLDPKWREHLSADHLLTTELPLADAARLALHEVATMGLQPWEPCAGVGWRSATLATATGLAVSGGRHRPAADPHRSATR